MNINTGNSKFVFESNNESMTYATDVLYFTIDKGFTTHPINKFTLGKLSNIMEYLYL